MKLSAEIRNQKELTDLLGKLAGGELRKAYALALNDTGFMVRGKQVAALNGSFDRVTPFVGRSPKVFKATPDKLAVSIAPRCTPTVAPLCAAARWVWTRRMCCRPRSLAGAVVTSAAR